MYKNILALCLGLIASLLIVEVSLRLFDPFQLRIRGDDIVLPKNREYKFNNNSIPQLDDKIVHTKNELGFRGPPPPGEFDEHLTMIAVGGSTTECFYLSDGHDWPAQLSDKLNPYFSDLWVNNAGLDGHSTYGHLHLLDQYLIDIKPDVILFLIGHNDMGLDQPKKFDRQIKKDIWITLENPKEMIRSFIQYSELLSTLHVAYRHYSNDQHGVTHGSVDLKERKTMEPDPDDLQDLKNKHKNKYIPGYRRRVEKLVKDSRDAGIEPVLITQPALYGNVTDPASGVNLGKVKTGDMPGSHRWKLLEMYNDVTRQISDEKDVPMIDLAKRLPKDSRYYYDFLHFTNEGASAISRLLNSKVCEILKQKFPTHSKSSCP